MGYPSAAQKPQWHISHFKVEHFIDRPVEQVWPIFCDIRRWITDYRIEAIDWPLNDPIKVGAISKVTPLYGEALNNPKMYYIMDIYEVIPESEIVLWLTAEHLAAFGLGELSAFYHWKLTETDGKTAIEIEQFQSAKPRDAAASDLLRLLREGSPREPESYHQYRSPTRSWIHNLNTLEKIVLANGGV